ncbi:hypothetical protein RMATCC62417_14935 [Rhizopus microsporus]|nr:hypothetical protein RMATCC62417_14935 [Rhizopus microsporus]
MQAAYDETPSLDSGNSSTVLNYLQILSKYRKNNRQVTDDYMCQLVPAKTSPGAPCALAHKTSTKIRQKARRPFKKSNQANQADDGRRTAIAYGDASLSGTKKGYTPIPVKVY